MLERRLRFWLMRQLILLSIDVIIPILSTENVEIMAAGVKELEQVFERGQKAKTVGRRTLGR